MEIFDLIAEPGRRRILDELRRSERTVGELVARVGASQPAVSRHLRLLREAGLVESTVAAQRRIYRLRPEGLRDLDAWLEPYRLLWSGRLDALESHLEEMSDES